MMKNFYFLLIVFYFLLFAATAYASQIDFFMDTQGKSINAIQGEISFPDTLELKEIKDGNSIINFWIERPSADSLKFSGIIPGGYNGENGFLFSAIFETKTERKDNVSLSNVRAFINDGKGTETEVKIFGQVPDLKPQTMEDNIPPESFVLEIASDQNLFEGKYFLVFATQDKKSGISRYEVKEGQGKEFVVAESPYLLRNQDLDQKIFVKAVDKAGNERIEVLYPSNWRPWYKNYWLFVIIMTAAIIVAAIILRKPIWQKSIKLR
jgi:hypothetical protein